MNQGKQPGHIERTIPSSEAGKLKIGDALTCAWRIFKGNWGKLTILSIPTTLMMGCAIIVALGFVSSGLVPMLDLGFIDILTLQIYPWLLWLGVGIIAILWIVSNWFNAGSIMVAAGEGDGQKVPLASALSRGFGVLGKFLIFSFLYLMILSPFIILMYYIFTLTVICLPQIYNYIFQFGSFTLSVALGLAYFAMAVEGAGVFASFIRSFKLISGSFWRAAGFLFLLGMIPGVVIAVPIIIGVVLAVAGVSSLVPYIALGVIIVFTFALSQALTWSGWGAIYKFMKNP